MKYPVMIAAAVAGFSTPAYAQDLSGFRIEGRVGWEQVGERATYPDPDDEDEVLSLSDDDSGISYGAELGYDVQIGSGVVLGAYAGVDFSDSEICGELVGDDLACTGLERTFAVGARAGLPLGETSLLYLKGGYSNGKFETTYDSDVTDNDDANPGAIAEFSESRGGYHVGGGLQLGLTRNLYAKLEYVYTDYGRRSHVLDEDDPTLDIGSHRHQALVGVGFRF